MNENYIKADSENTITSENIKRDYDLIIDCKKIELNGEGIKIVIQKDLGDIKSITINDIKFRRVENE